MAGSSVGTRSWRGPILLAAATIAAGMAFVELAPGPMTRQIRWLAANHTSSPDPVWDVPLDGAALRKAAGAVRAGDTYYVWYPQAQPQYSHDLLGAGLLFLTPALPVERPADATWILSYGTSPLTPPGVKVERTRELADGIYLVRVAH